MHNISVRSCVYVIIILSAVIWFSLATFNGLDLSKAKDFFSLVPKVITIDLLLIAIFAKWGWKLRIFRDWLVPFPDLNGTWVGNIYSDWISPETGKKPGPIPVMLTIRQTFFRVNCLMQTAEMSSRSYSENLTIEQEKQQKQLTYVYCSKPRISLLERNPPHDGAAVFQIIEEPSRKLKGHYWTERLSKGEIILTFHSKAILDEIPNDFGRHPVTEEENIR